MPHFVVFSNERLEGVHDFVGRLNGTNNTMDFTQIWDGATRDLGRAAFAHHLVFPEDTLVIVPSILDLFNWDQQVGRYLPYFSSVDVAVASFAQALRDILTNLMAVPVPCRVVFTDLVGVDCLTWAPIAGDAILQRWIDAIVPRANSEVAQANFWNGVPVVPFGRRIHEHRPTVDGVISVNDYRSMPDGFMPNRRQQRRWARVLIDLLEQY